MQETFLPLFLKNSTIPSILIIGGGKVATAKAEALLSVGSTMAVLTKDISNELRTICGEKGCSYTIADYQPMYLTGRRIVVAATNNSVLNKQIYQDCQERNI